MVEKKFLFDLSFLTLSMMNYLVEKYIFQILGGSASTTMFRKGRYKYNGKSSLYK